MLRTWHVCAHQLRQCICIQNHIHPSFKPHSFNWEFHFIQWIALSHSLPFCLSIQRKLRHFFLLLFFTEHNQVTERYKTSISVNLNNKKKFKFLLLNRLLNGKVTLARRENTFMDVWNKTVRLSNVVNRMKPKFQGYLIVGSGETTTTTTTEYYFIQNKFQHFVRYMVGEHMWH